MGDTDLMRTSAASARQMTRRHAKTFYFASHVLPRVKRADAYAVYAFCRHVDDEIDLAPDSAAREERFAGLKVVLDHAYGETPPRVNLPWLAVFSDTVHRRAIPRSYFDDLLVGVRMDCGPVRIVTWEELHSYCYHVASVVGLIMVHVLTEPAPDLLLPAQHLGTAMQLTNILRDIREDWERDRLYLPRQEMDKFGLGPDDVACGRTGDSFRALMRFQIGRARSYYSLAQPGIARLPDDGSRLTVRLMSSLYGAILDEIERADFQVYRRRVRVSFSRKVWLALTR
jgi:phytoene synthase